MIAVSELRKGVTFEENREIYKVLEYMHNKTGRGSATIRVSVRNLRTGARTDRTFSGNERVRDIELDHHNVTYMYNDGDLYYFMDEETYDQPAISAKVLGDAVNYLTEGLHAELETYEGEPISVELPTTVDLEVVATEPGIKGDTASGATKPATVLTGLTVTVPLFVNIGDTLRIDTRNGAYVTRV